MSILDALLSNEALPTKNKRGFKNIMFYGRNISIKHQSLIATRGLRRFPLQNHYN